jgi:PmbA protein
LKPEKICKHIISEALRRGATDAVAEVYVGREHVIKFANNAVAVAENRIVSSIDIFVAIDGRRAATSIEGLNMQRAREAVEHAIQLAGLTPPSDTYAPLPKGPFKYDEKLLRGSMIRGDPNTLIDSVNAAINAALSAGAKRAAGSLIYTRGRTWLLTSGEAGGSYEDSMIELSIRALASDNAAGHFVSIAARREDFRPEETGRRAGELAAMAVNPTEAEPGAYETLLGPMTLANLIEEVGEHDSAFHVESGLSFLADKVGESVASEKFTLIDDPTIPGTPGARPFDDEGLPTRRNVLIERGVLKTYLHNSATAKKFNTQTTANAGLIVPHPFNLVVEGGGGSLEKLISSIDDGIFVTNDWYLRYHNYRTGDFSTIPRDALLRIRRGGINGAVKGLRISDNIVRVFRSIRELSQERYWILWWEVETPIYAPYAVIDRLNFTRPTL